MRLELKPYEPSRTAAVSALICRTLREISSRDYPADEIGRLCAMHSEEHIRRISGERVLLTAYDGDLLVGTAALDCSPQGYPPGYGLVSTVFVLPEYQGKGVGRMLMESVEGMARNSGSAVLVLESSISACGFYRGLGFTEKPCSVGMSGRGLFPMEKKLMM